MKTIILKKLLFLASGQCRGRIFDEFFSRNKQCFIIMESSLIKGYRIKIKNLKYRIYFIFNKNIQKDKSLILFFVFVFLHL